MKIPSKNFEFYKYLKSLDQNFIAFNFKAYKIIYSKIDYFDFNQNLLAHLIQSKIFCNVKDQQIRFSKCTRS